MQCLWNYSPIGLCIWVQYIRLSTRPRSVRLIVWHREEFVGIRRQNLITSIRCWLPTIWPVVDIWNGQGDNRNPHLTQQPIVPSLPIWMYYHQSAHFAATIADKKITKAELLSRAQKLFLLHHATWIHACWVLRFNERSPGLFDKSVYFFI